MSRRKILLAGLILLLVVLQYRLWFTEGGIIHLWQLKQHFEQTNEKTEKLTARNKKLREEVRSMQANKHSVEAQARSELGMVNQGEEFYQIVDADPDDGKN